MKEVDVVDIIEAVKNMCINSNYYLGEDIKVALEKSKEEEDFPIAKEMLDKIITNSEIARNDNMPICQDTGMAIVFVELGQDVHIIGGNLIAAINEGVRRGYEDGFLRKSVVKDPINRVNTGDNTPAVIHIDLIQGEELKITVAPKGFGSENMSRVKMLKPADGVQGVKEFVLETIRLAGPNPCPPIIVGIGIGGSFEKVAELSKRALLRRIDESNENPYYEALEKELLEEINKLGIGPQGFGGKTTALGVNIETYPTHIASLPVAVNISCHATRHSEVIL